MRYYIINRADTNFGERICETAEEVAVYMWGRRLDQYHILKEDDLGQLLVVRVEGADVTRVRAACTRT
jgi:hypothetical protein